MLLVGVGKKISLAFRIGDIPFSQCEFANLLNL